MNIFQVRNLRQKMASPPTELDTSLLSLEKLDRSSPDLWPEQIPGVSDFVAIQRLNNWDPPRPKYMENLGPEDLNLLQEFGSLAASNLIDQVRKLQNLAYQLGLEESKEMTRGRYLNILETNTKK